MDGINRYYTQRRLAGVESLNESAVDSLLKRAASLAPQSTCIFLSHKSEDKEAVKKIGEHIRSKDLDIYLDVDDPNLQAAVRNNEHVAITKFIELGIRSCTHLMTLISEETKRSWWVPYEVGFGKSAKKAISTLKLKTVRYVPSFLQITTLLEDATHLDAYLMRIKRGQPQTKYSMTSDTLDRLIETIERAQSGQRIHPLSAYLDI
jgi:hypothetical protein